MKMTDFIFKFIFYFCAYVQFYFFKFYIYIDKNCKYYETNKTNKKLRIIIFFYLIKLIIQKNTYNIVD